MIVLDAKTDYSFLRGFGSPEQWLARCKDVGVTALGVADYCSTWGHIPFRDAFKGSGIKLLFGVQVPVVSFLDKDPRHSLVTLIAKESTDELYSAMTIAHKQTYYRPRLTWQQVSNLNDCFVIVNDLLTTHVKAVPAFAYIGHRLLPPDHLAKLDRPSVLAYAPCYPTPEHRRGFELFQAISSNHRIGEIECDDFHLLREGERNSIFTEINEDMLDNGVVIATECCAVPPQGGLMDMGVQGDKKLALWRMAYEGAEKMGLLTKTGAKTGEMIKVMRDPEYDRRLNFELDMIHDKNFEDYFFFVVDVIQWAKQRMFVGPGRGSAGGSLLCFLLGITTVDPLKFGTLFERFIDVTRSDLPDIDIDFPDTRREEVFEYLRTKYGAERVARIGTLTKLGGKSAINAAARATDVPFEASRDVGKWTEGHVQGQIFPPKWVFANVSEVQPVLERYPSLRLAALLDERETPDDSKNPQHVSHHGVHASGVVVTDGPCEKFGVVDREGVLSIDMKTAEKIGLVKMDALGLRTLSVIQETCDLIGMNPTDLYVLDWNDKAVFDNVFNADRVTGIFQFEGNAVRSLMKAVRVDNFNDICALSSLARPGPLIGGAAAGWVKARNGEAVGELLHPALEETYGVICYQEQFMWIARDLAGFDVAQVNGMRRAVAKKDPEKLRSYRDAFVKGVAQYFCNQSATQEFGPIAGGADENRAASLWEEICEFGSYAFNKAHAVEYGMISYMTAWLKHYHPLEFAVAQLRNAADDDQIKNLLRELTEEGYQYVPFDPVRSLASWSIADGVLFGGFDSIRGIGEKTADRLVVARDRAGDGSWLDRLTEAQRLRIQKAELRWKSLSHFSETYAALYKDPDKWRSEGIKKGIKPPVYRIRDLPEPKGSYAFLGRIVKFNVVDDDAPERVAKRDGKKRGKDRFFINLTIEDDTGEAGATINRFKYEDFKWISEIDLNGKDFLFRGNVIEAGRKWFFLDNVIELKGTGG